MASFEPRGSRVRAHVNLKGVRDSDTFPSKGAARAWATNRENEILAGARGDIPDKHFGAALQRYVDEMPLDRKGGHWERVRIKKTLRDPIALVRLAELSSNHVAEWRDRGLKGAPAVGDTPARKPIKGASVRREWNLLSYVCSIAIGEWKWLKLNPFSKAAGAKRPKNSKHRKELILEPDMAALQRVADEHGTETYRQVLRAARFAMRTGMRSGEVIFLGDNPHHVDTTTRVAHLPDTKNGNARDVPLAREAIRVWEEASAIERAPGRGVWGLTDETRDTHWRDMRDRAALSYPPVARLHFHDTRHTAVTWLVKVKKMQILPLARMIGHTDLNELMTYYNESAADIALTLD